MKMIRQWWNMLALTIWWVVLGVSQSFADGVLSVPVNFQQHDKWCWAAVSQSLLAYYGISQEQCAFANWAWSRSDCCGNANYSWDHPCNKFNTLYVDPNSVQGILEHWGVESVGQASALGIEAVRTEIDAGRPFVIRWWWVNIPGNTGHVVIGQGITGTKIFLFNPEYGPDIKEYSSVVSSPDRQWTHTLQMTTTPSYPSLPQLLSPSGSVCTLTPTYTWQASSRATSYCAHVTIADTTSPQTRCYSPEEAGCPGGVGTCSVTPDDIVLTDTYYTWQVEARNEVGSAWSPAMNFTVPLLPAVQIAPSGVINTDSPTYAWWAVEGATEYQLEVTAASQTPIFSAWYPAQDLGCASGGVCAVTPEGVLPEGAYDWRTLSMNGVCDDQSTFWNDGEGFTVALSPFPTPTPNPTPISDAYLLWTD